jgi:hypothetical protein
MSKIPYERMWIDDLLWLPKVLGGDRLQASFHFSNDGLNVLKENIYLMGRQKNRAAAYGREN